MTTIISRYQKPNLFFLFGDSITQRSNSISTGFSFASSLQDVYIRRLDVLNRGFSGYNTTQALELLPRIVAPPECAKIKYMTIFFGSNDACLPTSGTGQHVPLGIFKKNLSKIINHPLITEHKPRIILITPPPIDEYMRSAHLNIEANSSIDRTASQTAQYANAAREVGMQSKVAVLDIWTTFMQLAGWRLGDKLLPGSRDMEPELIFAELLCDGLHLNNLGYRILFTSLMNLIEETWPNEEQNETAFALPAWNDNTAWENLSSN